MLAWVSALVGVLAPVALAGWSASTDYPVLPDDGALPWSDPSHNSPLERLLTGLAAKIADRANVRVYCSGEYEWSQFGARREFDPEGVGGLVDAWYYVATRRIARDSTDMHLSPLACWHLWRFAVAAQKPTKCETTQTVTETEYRSERYQARVRVKVWKRVKVKGKWARKKVWATKLVWRTRQVPVQVTKEVPGPPAPCYGSAGAKEPADGWPTYHRYAEALLIFAHESIHLFDFRAGAPIDQPFEARAECFGMQIAPWVGTQLGASPDDAHSVARYMWERIYPRSTGTEYYSYDCRQDGPLDLTPGDATWP